MGKRSIALLCVLIAGMLSVAPSAASDTTTYSYDSLGRLVATVVSGGPSGGTQTSTGFDPAGNRTTYTVAGVPAPPSFSISNAAAVTEGGTLAYTVTRAGAASGAYTVNYASTGGTATSGTDFTPVTGWLTFAAGETSKIIYVGTIDDAVVEPAETVLINLSSPSAGATITTGQASGTINDNDLPPPSFAISNAASVSEGGTLAFTVTKTGATSTSFTVNYASASGTATSGTDFTPVAGWLTFLTGETSKIIYVGTIDDSSVEPAETVFVNLSSPTGGATITTAQGTGTINDNEPVNQPPVAVADSFSLRCNMIGPVGANLVTNDTDPEGNVPLALISVTRLSGGATISVNNSTGSVSVTGAPSVGTSTFSYIVQDSLGASSTGSVTVTTTFFATCS